MEIKSAGAERFFVAYGLSAHTHRIAVAAYELIGQDKALEAVPIVRSMFEAALTAHWVAQIDGAAEAFFNEQTRQRRNLFEGIPALGIASITPAEIETAKAALDEMEKLESNASTSFEAICADLAPGGDSAYTQYRMMCQLTHASAFLGGRYWD